MADKKEKTTVQPKLSKVERLVLELEAAQRASIEREAKREAKAAEAKAKSGAYHAKRVNAAWRKEAEAEAAFAKAQDRLEVAQQVTKNLLADVKPIQDTLPLEV